MKIVVVINSILVGLLISVIMLVVFLIGTFLIFSGHEQSGSMVNFVTVVYFVVAILLGLFVSRKFYIYTKEKSSSFNLFSGFLLLASLVGIVLCLQVITFIPIA
jgi:hypothetical protein